jgi:hypothetical protein
MILSELESADSVRPLASFSIAFPLRKTVAEVVRSNMAQLKVIVFVPLRLLLVVMNYFPPVVAVDIRNLQDCFQIGYSNVPLVRKYRTSPDSPGPRQSRGERALSSDDTLQKVGIRTRLSW